MDIIIIMLIDLFLVRSIFFCLFRAADQLATGQLFTARYIYRYITQYRIVYFHTPWPWVLVSK